VPVCGSNGPPGRTYFAATQLSNCGNCAFGRIPLVAMNDAEASWLFAPGAPNDQLSELNGLSTPITS
jgi:hypothetical protein